jgi:uncharacterized protein
MLGVQAARAALVAALWAWLRPTPTSPVWLWIDLAAYTLTGLGLLAIFRPAPAALGLGWQGLSKRARGLVLGFSGLLLMLVLTTVFIDPALLLENVKNALLIPAFEELIFRGWIWGKLEQSIRGKYAGAWVWLINAGLFALWHLGYMDIYLLKAIPASPGLDLGFFLVMKLATTFVIGLMVAFVRWRTRRLYGAVILHGLINLFGK